MAMLEQNELDITDDTEITKAALVEGYRMQSASIRWSGIENCVTLVCAVAGAYFIDPWVFLLLINLFRNKTGLK